MATTEMNCLASGGGISETDLWTNGNPSSSYSGGVSETLSKDIDNFDELGFEYCYSTSQTSLIYEVRVPVESFKISSTNSRQGFGVNYLGNNLFRVPVYSTNTSLTISGCYYLGSSSSDNSMTIPLRIIGYKYG